MCVCVHVSFFGRHLSHFTQLCRFHRYMIFPLKVNVWMLNNPHVGRNKLYKMEKKKESKINNNHCCTRTIQLKNRIGNDYFETIRSFTIPIHTHTQAHARINHNTWIYISIDKSKSINQIDDYVNRFFFFK